MTKSVLISIKPLWCDKIANGEKTIEVRKTRPKLEPPFKCYIYCTKGEELWKRKNKVFLGGRYNPLIDDLPDYLLNQKVIGEFICDKIYQYSTGYVDGVDISDDDMIRFSCLSKEELCEYETSAEPKEGCIYHVGLYGWNISNLIIYDNPKFLGDFQITRPPQSWRYVQEI